MRRLLRGLLFVLMAVPAAAHTPSAEGVIAEVENTALGVSDVRRDPKLPRLLLVRVGPAWSEAAPARRRAAAETWLAHWRAAVPQGVVAVLDARTDEPVVNFDAEGRARLVDGER